MRAAILAIGTELTEGRVVDTNSAYLATHLTELDIPVMEVLHVPDDMESMQKALRDLSSRFDLLIVTGGLGPTVDDFTREALAEVLGVSMARNDDAAEAISEKVRAFGVPVLPSHLKQADVPEGARMLTNPVGTAPGIEVTLGRARTFVFPGVPRELYAMAEAHLFPVLNPTRRQTRTFKFVGIGESSVDEGLQEILAHGKYDISLCARISEVVLRLQVKPGEDTAPLLREAEQKIQSKFRDSLYAIEDRSLEEVLVTLLKARGLSLAFAESCTGGLVSGTLTHVPGSSEVLKGSVVTYTEESKIRLLEISPEMLKKETAVSEAVALSMASSVRRLMGSDIGLGVTGWAGPGGGTDRDPVGRVYIAIEGLGQKVCERNQYRGDRATVRHRALIASLNLVRKLILSSQS